MTRCTICGHPTSNTQTARVGDTTGPVCPDCAYWCDGNLTEQR